MDTKDIVQNMGYCGLVCTFCHEVDKCDGCKSENNCCGRRLGENSCFQFDCCVKTGINGC